jgi:hypothetical protein
VLIEAPAHRACVVNAGDEATASTGSVSILDATSGKPLGGIDAANPQADDAASLDHAAMRDFVTHTPETLLVPVTDLPEIDYLITTTLGAEAPFGQTDNGPGQPDSHRPPRCYNGR